MKTRLGPAQFGAAYGFVWIVTGAATCEVVLRQSNGITGLEGLVVLLPAIGLLQVPFTAWLTYRARRRLSPVLRAGIATAVAYLGSLGLLAVFTAVVSGDLDPSALAAPIWPLLIPAAACGLLVAGLGLQRKTPLR